MYSIVIDQGNTATKVGILCDGQFVRTYTLHQPTIREIEGLINKVKRKPQQAIYASVTGEDERLISSLHSCIDGEVYVLQSDLPIPLDMKYDRQTIGADRIAAAVGARQINGDRTDLLVIDMGTCITIDRISASGTFLGGNISPGVRMRLRALHEFTGRLPLTSEPDSPDFIGMYGHNTQQAIVCGVMNGIAHELDGYISEARVEQPDITTFITGGHSLHFGKRLKNVTFARRDLVCMGLARILDYQYERCVAP